MAIDAKALHSDSIVIDGTRPGEWWREQYGTWLAGGASSCVVTVAAWESCRDTIGVLGATHRFIRDHDELVLATSVQDIRNAKRDGRLAVVLHFQGTHPMEYDENLVEAYWRLGVRVVQLAYNTRSPVGDGCEEPSDAGLSRFGRKVVAEFNRTRIVVDVSHTGARTSLDVLAASNASCIASHSNAPRRALQPPQPLRRAHPRDRSRRRRYRRQRLPLVRQRSSQADARRVHRPHGLHRRPCRQRACWDRTRLHHPRSTHDGVGTTRPRRHLEPRTHLRRGTTRPDSTTHPSCPTSPNVSSSEALTTKTSAESSARKGSESSTRSGPTPTPPRREAPDLGRDAPPGKDASR